MSHEAIKRKKVKKRTKFTLNDYSVDYSIFFNLYV